ncbi:hypothetical protein LOAG_08160 [Loa loa]|uniref:Uncharacterized protein n=1 Tax=Loa loa TaxID=7209 RepID=A0A1S0TUA4_LOALO|nr:hypothetical protein LOAG_08160 [Loa loa]EFO20332.1 hypothetical protein LOAG_08160 [Loa loa]
MLVGYAYDKESVIYGIFSQNQSFSGIFSQNQPSMGIFSLLIYYFAKADTHAYQTNPHAYITKLDRYCYVAIGIAAEATTTTTTTTARQQQQQQQQQQRQQQQ